MGLFLNFCFILTNHCDINLNFYNVRPLPFQISAKFNLLQIETNNGKVENTKNCKLFKNSQKFITICNNTNMTSTCFFFFITT